MFMIDLLIISKTVEIIQSYVGTAADTGNASVIANISKTLTTTDLSGIGVSNSFSSYGYSTSGDETATWTANPIFITSTQMNVSTQKSAVDRLKLTFQYDKMHAIKSKNGREWPSMIEHRIYLRYKNPGDSSFTEDLMYGPTDSTLLARQSNKRVHGWIYSSSGTVEAYCKNPFVEVFDIRNHYVLIIQTPLPNEIYDCTIQYRFHANLHKVLTILMSFRVPPFYLL